MSISVDLTKFILIWDFVFSNPTSRCYDVLLTVAIIKYFALKHNPIFNIPDYWSVFMLEIYASIKPILWLGV